MYQSPTVPRSIGGVLDDSIQLFRASFSKAVVPALLMSAVVVAQLLIQLSSGSLGAPSNGTLGIMGVATAASAAAGSALVSLLGSLFDIVLYGTIVLITIGVARGEAPTFRTAFAGAWRRFGALLGASILVGLVGGFGFILAAIPIFLNLSGLTTGASFPQIVARLTPQIIESLLLCLPVIYVLSRMMLYTVPILGESQSASQSIGTSWRLVGGNWWRTSTVVFVLGIVVYVLMIVVIAVAGAGAAFVVSGRAGSQHAAVAAALSVGIALGATRVISSPLVAAMFVAVYRDLQLRKGGGDLEARLGALRKS
ncbi:MAG TPA: hypothetical protein VGL28_11495 [Steroidobacteraceae bacterium]|jgi:hypothetical protein